MKITLNLSPYEIQKLGKLVGADYAECWNKLIHTEDDIILSIHKLIYMIDEIVEKDNHDDDNDITEEYLN